MRYGWSIGLQPVIGKVVWMEKGGDGMDFWNCPWDTWSRGRGELAWRRERALLQVNMPGLTALLLAAVTQTTEVLQ
jgi:hypothetical protein